MSTGQASYDMFSSADEATNYNQHQGGYSAEASSETTPQFSGSTMPPSAAYYNPAAHNQPAHNQQHTQSQNAYGNAQQPYVHNL